VEGDILAFDDAFEHEVWNNSTRTRVVLVVDLWHPNLLERESERESSEEAVESMRSEKNERDFKATKLSTESTDFVVNSPGAVSLSSKDEKCINEPKDTSNIESSHSETTTTTSAATDSVP
jgi:aspartyl/asparaginyl beta-hydroxylase (cupin superfamily)